MTRSGLLISIPKSSALACFAFFALDDLGFGCFVLERVTVNALGEGKLEFNSDGLVWTCVIRPEHLVDGEADKGKSAAAAPQQVAAQ